MSAPPPHLLAGRDCAERVQVGDRLRDDRLRLGLRGGDLRQLATEAAPLVAALGGGRGRGGRGERRAGVGAGGDRVLCGGVGDVDLVGRRVADGDEAAKGLWGGVGVSSVFVSMGASGSRESSQEGSY